MAKPAKSIPAATEAAAKTKSKKLMVIIIAALGLLIASGAAGWYFLSKGSSHAEAAKPLPALAPIFIKLDTFTVNLQHMEGEEERVLQTVINLEIHDAELAEKIKLFMPKIYNNVLILLSRKRSAEISTPDGKQQLANEIKAEIEFALGLRAAPAPVTALISHEGGAASGVETALHAAPVAAERAPQTAHGKSEAGITDVLFTSFIIQ